MSAAGADAALAAAAESGYASATGALGGSGGLSGLGSSIYGGLASMGPVGWAGAAALAAGTAIAASQPKSSPLNHYKYDPKTDTGGWTKPENFDGTKFTPEELNSYFGPAMDTFIKTGNAQQALQMLPQPRTDRERILFEGGGKSLFGGSGNPMRKVAKKKGYEDGIYTKGNKDKKATIKYLEQALSQV
jgi:hypothetical protein